ncbi:MAG: hypothetical protein LBL64_00425 [Treponema sp.]|jgi:hypothetical protein|nr:hypothetical protein [Treponema sp.]
MKRLGLLLVVLAVSGVLYAQVGIPAYSRAAGSWDIEADGRLYQNDEKAGLAKVNIQIPQEGAIEYPFSVRYEKGAEDGHGGFGIHVFGDRVINSPSWGSGRSYLLWLNYDLNPGSSRIPSGLSAQVYRSYTNSYMELIDSVDLNEYVTDVYEDDLEYPVPFRIVVDGSSGDVRVYDPRDPGTYFYYNINVGGTALKGDWVALRTNGVSLSFAMDLD